MSDKHATLENRDGFQSKWGFILACIGSAVGMGNIWRVPIMVQQFGGMTFLIPYFLFVLLIGSTGIIEEFALGRWAQGGPVISFGKATEDRTGNKRLGEAIGALPIVGSMMLAIGYTVVMSWIFKYCWMGISGSRYALGTAMATIGGTFGGTAPEAETLGEALLRPTVIYVKPVLRCIEAADVKGVSHITGGGFYENVPRCIPDGLCARIDKAAIKTPAIFRLLQKKGSIDEHDMFNTFNMGVGMAVIVSPETADAALSALKAEGIDAYVCGEIVAGEEKVVLC